MYSPFMGPLKPSDAPPPPPMNIVTPPAPLPPPRCSPQQATRARVVPVVSMDDPPVPIVPRPIPPARPRAEYVPIVPAPIPPIPLRPTPQKRGEIDGAILRAMDRLKHAPPKKRRPPAPAPDGIETLLHEASLMLNPSSRAASALVALSPSPAPSTRASRAPSLEETQAAAALVGAMGVASPRATPPLVAPKPKAAKRGERRGLYKCGRCGEIKVNHVCKYAAAPVAVVGVQADPRVTVSLAGARTLTCRPRALTPATLTPAKRPAAP